MALSFFQQNEKNRYRTHVSYKAGAWLYILLSNRNRKGIKIL